jgi:hypothetical protein
MHHRTGPKCRVSLTVSECRRHVDVKVVGLGGRIVIGGQCKALIDPSLLVILAELCARSVAQVVEAYCP